MEEWKGINATNGMIEVSNLGRVRSLLRGKPYILKTQADKKGYHRLRVTICRTRYSFKLHREVAKAFIPNPCNLPQVNHKDGNKDNNSVSNLEWCTNKENANHAVRMGLWDNNFAKAKEVNDQKSKPIMAYKDDEILYFDSIHQAERILGTKHITAVLNGKRNHALGWKFAFAKGGDVRDSVKASSAI